MFFIYKKYCMNRTLQSINKVFDVKPLVPLFTISMPTASQILTDKAGIIPLDHHNRGLRVRWNNILSHIIFF